MNNISAYEKDKDEDLGKNKDESSAEDDYHGNGNGAGWVNQEKFNLSYKQFKTEI